MAKKGIIEDGCLKPEDCEKIQKIGGSLCMIIPKDIVRKFGIKKRNVFIPIYDADFWEQKGTLMVKFYRQKIW